MLLSHDKTEATGYTTLEIEQRVDLSLGKSAPSRLPDLLTRRSGVSLWTGHKFLPSLLMIQCYILPRPVSQRALVLLARAEYPFWIGASTWPIAKFGRDIIVYRGMHESRAQPNDDGTPVTPMGGIFFFFFFFIYRA